MLIPPQENFSKNIYITHKDLDLLDKSANKWKELNPEYNINLYDNKMCKKFLLEYYGKLYCDIFEYIKDGPIKCDFWRLCILYVYGGIYVDADIEPLISLKDYIEDDIDFCTCHSYNYRNINQDTWCYNPHFIVCKKFDINIYNCINKYVLMYLNNYEYAYWEWSICKLFSVINKDLISLDNFFDNKSGIFFYNSKKYQFLEEIIFYQDGTITNILNENKDNNNVLGVYCAFNKMIVLNNHIFK